MDHLPRPSSRNYQGDDVRHPGTKLLCRLPDNNHPVPFERYPLVHGFSYESLHSGSFLQDNAHHAAAVFQNWLFFGLMEEAFRERVPSADFIETCGDHEYFIHTRLLKQYLERWGKQVTSSSPEKKSEWAERTHFVFREATNLLKAVYQEVGQQYPKDFGVYLNLLAVLLETLEYGRAEYYSISSPKKLDSIIPNYSTAIFDEFVQKGWCAYTVKHILLSDDSPSVLAYAGLFRSNPSFITKSHQNCAPDLCVVSNVDVATYVPKHASNDCHCAYLKPDITKVAEAIRSGFIPVLGLNESEDEIVTFTYKWGDTELPYVAVSHVWADGLGSSSEVGLPMCQIRSLNKSALWAQNKVDDTKGGVVRFWIDSLCIPLVPDLRGLAIGLMAKTYARASVVLVLDESIRQILPSDPIYEKMFTIFVSTWVQRLWPLQEMMLAQKLVFQIFDEMLDVHELFTEEIVCLAGQDPLTTELFGWLGTLLMNKTTDIVYLDMIVWHLSRRTSSRESDEILAIAGLFGLDASEYVPLDAEERMFKFLKDHAKIRVPTDIIFLPGEKLSTPGRRWAPRKFIATEKWGNRKAKYHDDMAAVLDIGLFGRYYCLILKQMFAATDVSAKYRVIVENTMNEFIVTIEANARSRNCHAIDIFVLMQSIEDSEEFLGLAGTTVEEQEFAEEGETILVLEPAHNLNFMSGGQIINQYVELPSIIVRQEQRFLLLR